MQMCIRDSFLNAELASMKIADAGFTKQFTSRISLPFENGKEEVQKMKFYFGPNHFNTLKAVSYTHLDVYKRQIIIITIYLTIPEVKI